VDNPWIYESPDGETIFARRQSEQDRYLMVQGQYINITDMLELMRREAKEKHIRSRNMTVADAYAIYQELIALEEETNGTYL
jgi:hypothetical protein